MRIIVTGAAGGIGHAIAAALRLAGHELLCCDVAPGCVYLDVCDEAEVNACFTNYGPVDAVVHCAGLGVFKPFDELTAADLRRLLDVNVTGAFIVSQAAVRLMREHGGGRIVHLGSVAGTQPLDGSAGYGASKAALAMLCQSINREFGAAGVRATCITLGGVYTPMWEERPGFSASDMLSITDVARTVRSIVETPLSVRIDALTLLPPKGIL